MDPFDYRTREEAEVRGKAKRCSAQHCLFHDHSASLFGAFNEFHAARCAPKSSPCTSTVVVDHE